MSSVLCCQEKSGPGKKTCQIDFLACEWHGLLNKERGAATEWHPRGYPWPDESSGRRRLCVGQASGSPARRRADAGPTTRVRCKGTFAISYLPPICSAHLQMIQLHALVHRSTCHPDFGIERRSPHPRRGLPHADWPQNPLVLYVLSSLNFLINPVKNGLFFSIFLAGSAPFLEFFGTCNPFRKEITTSGVA